MNNEDQITLLENELENLQAELEYLQDRRHAIDVRMNIITNILHAELPQHTREFLCGFN